MSDGLSEIVCGSAAGAIGKIVEYPFDTTKVRLQTQDPLNPQFSGAMDCMAKALKAEGIWGLYRGLSSPMVGAAAENAVLFFAFNHLTRWTKDLGMGPTQQAILCGSGAGLAASAVLTPIELVKSRIQVSYLAGVSHKSIRQHVGEIIRVNGIFGLWKGQLGTAIREAGGSAAWFGSYRYVMNWLNPERADPKIWQSMLSGAAAGVMYNLSLFPADTIKSRMQTDSIMSRESQSFFKTGALLYHQGGFRALYRGVGITCARAAPSSAIIFLTYEQLTKLWDRALDWSRSERDKHDKHDVL